MSTLQYIGSQIRSLRKGNKWTLSELSKRSGVTLNYLAQLERGEVNVSVNKLDKVLQALNVEWSLVVPSPYDTTPLKAALIKECMELEDEKHLHIALSLVKELRRFES
ncbi:helix-turn-helix transcriptional regulator [Halalkalibacterium halodurans]|jgi:transcriptional regulator with XRE-family HTH domain|uniref:Transcriptional regulator n=2 Tax=Halalkalibacterium halodurans TaxID=86665 RepID=Q9KEA9_HALH5|nr:helix-turn-helix transcriptional regulator [Halalkalibacterium halodurans]MDY7221443.1 helix-turn-helix transcriptional regulator [Halalkalibacterium halodurans]MDY7240682.1 helix-turn-helix transcriptional regulator [Halalkalibacterium halodurans]MED3648381.1 helix-turn-helix transcriptional regulator [Halalkalibacterium halodurans]MED4082969.1 helix-turn-helix transcriptional regulator [Halalkalibacterium halodurans]MED4086800.1 helix-turn-helix transcriptional regulator [Halalkalibacteri